MPSGKMVFSNKAMSVLGDSCMCQSRVNKTGTYKQKMFGYTEDTNLNSTECHQVECHSLDEIQVLLYICLEVGVCCPALQVL